MRSSVCVYLYVEIRSCLCLCGHENCISMQRKFQKPTDFQVQKQDPEELNNVCKVMEDLIRMHLSIFVVSHMSTVHVTG